MGFRGSRESARMGSAGGCWSGGLYVRVAGIRFFDELNVQFLVLISV